MDPNKRARRICLLLTLGVTILATSVVGKKFEIQVDQFHTCIPMRYRPHHTATVPSVMIQMSGETMRATRHHIIPLTILKEFINLILSQNPLGSGFGAYLAINVREIYRYFEENAAAGAPLPFAGPLRNNPDVLFLIGDRPITFGGRSASFEADHRMLAAYTWMPANLFYGPPPDRRGRDPGDNFEVDALSIVGSDAFEVLRRLYINMRNFINNPRQRTATNYDIIMADLIKLASERSRPYEFNPHQWEEIDEFNSEGKQKYAIKRSTVVIEDVTSTTRVYGHDELKKRSVGGDLVADDYINAIESVCADYVKHLKPKFSTKFTSVDIDYDVGPLFVYSTQNNKRHFVYGQNAKTLNWFIKSVDEYGRVGAVTAQGSWQFYYAVQIHFEINGKHYFYGHNLNNHYWFIQALNADGTMGPETANGYFAFSYKTMFYINIDGKHYLYGQNEIEKKWFQQQLKPDGTLGDEVSHGTWHNFYDIQFPFKIGENDQYFGGFNSQSKQHFIRDINSNNLNSMGKPNVWTTLDRSYSVFFPFSLAGKTYFFGHEPNTRHFFIRQIFANVVQEENLDYEFTDARPFNLYGYQYFYAKVKGGSRWSLFHFDFNYNI